MQSTTDDDLVAAVATADEDLATARERIAEFGEEELERLADAYDEFTDLLDRYEEPATGDGDFQTFIEFQGKIESAVERYPDDLLLRETFEEADEFLQQRRLTESDFEHVREQLSPVADLVGRLDDRRDARKRYRRVRERIKHRRRELGERIDHLERLQRLGDADLTAPTEQLREPIQRYNTAVKEAFEEFLSTTNARTVVQVLEQCRQYPLVGYEPPPPDLREFLETHDVGIETIDQLLEYADYSRSKLDHYLDDPTAFNETVGARQTYLRRLDGEPLTIGWPPPETSDLVIRAREYRAVVNRFAPDIVEHLRTVRRLPVTTEYERIRETAVAREELSESERERLHSGDIAEEISSVRAERERLATALEEYPGP